MDHVAEVLNSIFKECGNAGIHISDDTSPLVHRNKMFVCDEHGIFITGSVSDACVVEENEMMWCPLAGIDVINGATRTVARNVVERGNDTGVHVHDGGRGIFTQNSIRLNSKAGVVVRTSSEAILDASLISDR
jgi:hypothetical protein